jgi:DNA gyrase subunit A
MATNLAPHNLSEVIDATIELIKNPECELIDLMKHIPGPDFPTGGIIYGRSGILDAYRSGKGRVVIRARAEVEKIKNDREQIIVTEIPYMVNKSTMLERIADLVRQKQIEGISFLRDESDRRGLRIVIGIKKDAYAEVVLNQLYKYTQLQSTFGINALALVNMRPQTLTLKQILEHFVNHRHDVVTRRTQYELNKAQDRAHILEGLRIAIDNIDEIVELIKTSASPEQAHERLSQRFGLSDAQCKAILEMRLQRLTGLERDKIEAEYNELQNKIAYLTELLQSKEKRMALIEEELQDIKKRFGDERRTEIVDAESDVDIEDMIADEDMIITMTHGGYIKRCAATTYKAQGRGGRGIKGMDSKDDDFVQTLFVASAHTTILFFTNTGRCYSMKVYRIPEASRQSRGRPIINMLELKPQESVAAFVTVKEFVEDSFVIMATRNGVVNKQPLSAYRKLRVNGVNAISLDPTDALISCCLTGGNSDVLLATASGQAVRFHESATRELGRNTRGVKGITLKGSDRVIGMVVAQSGQKILTVTSLGYGKKTEVDEYRKTNRGGSGIRNIKCTDKNGEVISIMVVDERELDLMLITRKGIIIRSNADTVSTIGRNTQGLRLINLGEGDNVIDAALVERVEDGEPTDTEEDSFAPAEE